MEKSIRKLKQTMQRDKKQKEKMPNRQNKKGRRESETHQAEKKGEQQRASGGKMLSF